MNNEINNKIKDALFDFYLEADQDTINESIIEDTQNLDEYTKKKKQILFIARATCKKQRNDSLLVLVEKFHNAIEKNIEKPISVLKQLLQGEGSLAYYRNLDKLSKDDIIEIIKDKNLIELLEMLEDNESQH